MCQNNIAKSEKNIDFFLQVYFTKKLIFTEFPLESIILLWPIWFLYTRRLVHIKKVNFYFTSETILAY